MALSLTNILLLGVGSLTIGYYYGLDTFATLLPLAGAGILGIFAYGFISLYVARQRFRRLQKANLVISIRRLAFRR